MIDDKYKKHQRYDLSQKLITVNCWKNEWEIQVCPVYSANQRSNDTGGRKLF